MYCTLGLHSEHTIGKSSIRIKDLSKKFKRDEVLSLVDNGTISGLISILNINKYNIPAVELFITEEYNNVRTFHVARFFAFDEKAYRAMCQMLSIANQNFYYTPRLAVEDIIYEGDLRIIVDEDFYYIDKLNKEYVYLAVNDESDLSNPAYIKYKTIFYYDSYCYTEQETKIITTLSARNFEHKKPVWFLNDSHYKKALLVPGAIEEYKQWTSNKNIVIDFKNRYPYYSDNAADLFEALVDAGFSRKYKNPTQIEIDRVEYEKKIIKKMGFCDYFLITWDFIDWARKNDIPIGPGRGSAAGSIVAYCLDITKLEPVSNGLYFERFLNPERVSPPDIDTDINKDDRQQVIDYIKNKYGKDRVSQIITFMMLKSKMAFKDACRLHDIDAFEANRITKFFPPMKYGVPPTLDEAASVDVIKNWIDQYPKVWYDAKSIEGFVRNTGIHAAGVIIAPEKLADITGLKYADQDTICQWSKDDAEKFGLLKMDLLGLDTLGLIKNVCKKIGKSYYDMENIPLDDEQVYAAFREGDTHGIFQFESPGMKRLLRRIAPTKFADIAAATALYRPGPLQAGLTEKYVKNKNAEIPDYFIPEFEELLGETYGVMTYQEQVMKISQEIAGFSLPKADKLRKAIGKKNKEEMEKLQSEFVEGAISRGFDEEKIKELWSQIVGFADYCFNKSHSYAYALISYWTMYLKVKYPKEFVVCLLTSDMKNTSKMQTHFFELQGKVDFTAPLINEAEEGFSIKNDKVMIGLGCIKSIGNEASKISENKPYDSVVEVVTKNSLDKTKFINLTYAGAFDKIISDKSVLLGNYKRILEYGKQNKSSDFISLFDPSESFIMNYNLKQSLDTNEKIEKEAYGYNIFYGYIIANNWIVKALPKNIIVGTVTEVKRTKTKKNQDMAIYSIDSINGKVTVLVFPKYYDAFALYVVKDKTYAFEGELSGSNRDDDEDNLTFKANRFVETDKIILKNVELRVRLDYNEEWFKENLEPLIISEGDTELTIFKQTHMGWERDFIYPRKIKFTKEIYDFLNNHGFDPIINIF